MDPNAMHVDPFIRSNRELAQTDDHTLAYVLLHLASAVGKRSYTFEEIRNLNLVDLRPRLASGEYAEVGRRVLERLSSSRAGPSMPMGGQAAVLKAFASPYRGDTVTLRKAIDQVINDLGLYANAIPFVQSAGTGKSRLMVELGKEFFVVIANLRDDDPEGSFSFPDPDVAVRKYLHEMEYTKDVPQSHLWRLRYAAFLCAIFDVFSERLGKGVPSEFAKNFETQSSRALYFDRVIECSKSFETQFIETFSKSETHCCLITSPYLYDKAMNCFKQLRLVNPSERPPPLVLALDEAHVMTKRDGSSVRGSLFDIFCSVLADLKEYWGIIPFATIFLSTNIRLNTVAPSVGQIASQRLRTTSLAGALTCVPFDVFVEQNTKWTVEEISTLRFISTFGRPLFGALIRNGLDPILALNHAQEKLAHAKRPFSAEMLMSNQIAFALLSRRILLYFRPLQGASATMGLNLIARHLQVAFVVPTHRQFVVSGSPSEPFLIEAAAHMMATPDFSTIRCLLNFANEGLLNAGEGGEILGRLLTIDAYDMALRSRAPATSIYHSWVPVLGFLKALFSDQVYEDIIKIKPYRQPCGQTLGEAFKNAVIRLTHYVRLSQLSLINAANMRKAFLRGMGLVGAASQKSIDTFVPILFVDLDKWPSDWIVDEAKMSHFMANWRNKATDATPPYSDPYDEYKKLNSELPTILMWNQFGSKKSKHVLPQITKTNHPGRAVYFIHLYGIGPEIYRGITETNDQEYQRFVDWDDMFRDAPFIFEEYTSAVEHTLPRWSATSFEQTAW